MYCSKARAFQAVAQYGCAQYGWRYLLADALLSGREDARVARSQSRVQP